MCALNAAPITITQPSVLNMTLASTVEHCAGTRDGSITATATGGTSPYQYSKDGGTNWQNSNMFTGLSNGTYTITVRDNNGCMTSSEVTVGLVPCIPACTYTQGFYGNDGGQGCNGDGTSSNQLRKAHIALNATNGYVFGVPDNNRTFTLVKADSVNISKMLPGGGPNDWFKTGGGNYATTSTWGVVPIATSGNLKGRIRNNLFGQTLTLYLNLYNSSSLGGIVLKDTLLTVAIDCATGQQTPGATAQKFGIPHSVIMYLASNTTDYPNGNVWDLFKLANNVLGGAIPKNVLSPDDVQKAVDAINNAFDECRLLVGTLNYVTPSLMVTNSASASEALTISEKVNINSLSVTAYPNPYKDRFDLRITSPVSGLAIVQYFDVTGAKVFETKTFVQQGIQHSLKYTGPAKYGAMRYVVTISNFKSSGMVIKP
jgi:hypothetical protein